MNGVALLIAAASLGVDYSWEKAGDGRVEYLIQAEAEVLPALLRGEQIHSPVPTDAGSVQRLRLRITGASAPPASSVGKPASRYGNSVPEGATVVIKPGADPVETRDVSTGWQPDKDGAMQFYVQIDPTLTEQLGAGDEIVVPIDPPAGTVANFVVSSGRIDLPRAGGSPASPPAGNATATNTTGESAAPSRFGNGTETASAGGETSRFGAADSTATDSASGTATSRFPATGAAPDAAPAPSRFSTNDGATPAENANSSRFPASSSSNSVSPPGSSSVYDNNRSPADSNPSRFNNGQDWSTSRPPAGGQVGTDRTPPGQPPARNDLWPNNRSTAPPSQTPPALADSRSPAFGNGPNGGTTMGNDSPRPLPDFNRGTGEAQRTGFETPTDNRVAMNDPGAGRGAAPSPATAAPPAPAPAATEAAAEPKPWGWFVTVCCIAFLSIGANLYLGWTAAEFYSRYRSAVERLRTNGGARA